MKSIRFSFYTLLVALLSAAAMLVLNLLPQRDPFFKSLHIMQRGWPLDFHKWNHNPADTTTHWHMGRLAADIGIALVIVLALAVLAECFIRYIRRQ